MAEMVSLVFRHLVYNNFMRKAIFLIEFRLNLLNLLNYSINSITGFCNGREGSFFFVLTCCLACLNTKAHFYCGLLVCSRAKHLLLAQQVV